MNIDGGWNRPCVTYYRLFPRVTPQYIYISANNNNSKYTYKNIYCLWHSGNISYVTIVRYKCASLCACQLTCYYKTNNAHDRTIVIFAGIRQYVYHIWVIVLYDLQIDWSHSIIMSMTLLHGANGSSQLRVMRCISDWAATNSMNIDAWRSHNWLNRRLIPQRVAESVGWLMVTRERTHLFQEYDKQYGCYFGFLWAIQLGSTVIFQLAQLTYLCRWSMKDVDIFHGQIGCRKGHQRQWCRADENEFFQLFFFVTLRWF